MHFSAKWGFAMDGKRFQPVPLFALAVCITLGLILCGFVLDVFIGRENKELWARAVRWIAVCAVVFGMVGAYDAWKRRQLGK
jgi:uncharacterized membrane protein